jgi:3-methyl-2-oxobutanoate hydroxymethyltransferase
VIVTHDAMGLTPNPPRFAPRLADLATPAVAGFAQYVRQVRDGMYPSAEHEYQMEPGQRAQFLRDVHAHEGEAVEARSST